MTKDYKMFDWTNVNQESNKKLMDDLMWDLGLLTPEGVLMVMPDKLSDSLIAVADRLEFYHEWNEQQKRLQHLKPYKPIAHIVYKDGTIIPVNVYEEGHSCVEDILVHLQSDIDDKKEITKLQCGTVIKLCKVVKIVDQESGEEFIIRHDPKIAWIVDNEWTAFPVQYEGHFESPRFLAEYIKAGIEMGKDSFGIEQDGNTLSINIEKAWKVIDYGTQEYWIVNESNKPHERPTLKEMNSIQLRDEISRLSEQVSFAIDDDDLDEITEIEIEALDLAIDELDERCTQHAFDVGRLDNILMSFIGEYKLYDLFADHAEKLVKELDDPEDTYQVGKEMYGEDLADFIKQRPWLVGK